MAIQTLHDTGEEYKITPKYDGGVYASGVKDGVCKGIGDEFTLNYTNNSLAISFNAGSQAVICGAFFKVTSSETITLSANTTTYLCANIDLSKANGRRGSFEQRASSEIANGNLNGDGTSRDLLLYVITTGTSGVTNVIDRRPIISTPKYLDEASKLNLKINNVNVGTYNPNSVSDMTLNINAPAGFGINTQRLLASFNQNSNVSYTATENCVCIFGSASQYGGIYIDNVMLWGASGGSYQIARFFPLAKGQNITCTYGNGTISFKVYAVK